MIQEVSATVTNTAGAVSGMPPNQVSYLQIHNPHATASVAYTLDGSTPVVNGTGFTLGPLGTSTFDSPGGTTVVCAGLKMISSTATQTVSILWGGP